VHKIEVPEAAQTEACRPSSPLLANPATLLFRFFIWKESSPQLSLRPNFKKLYGKIRTA